MPKKKNEPKYETIEDLARYYEETKLPELSNQKTYNSCIQKILDFFPKAKPEKISAADCQRYTVKRRKDGAKDSTIIRELGVLSAICTHARNHRKITTAQLPVIHKPEAPPPKDIWLSEAQLCEVLTAAKAFREQPGRVCPVEVFLWIAIMTAARKGAIEELTWDQVDWETSVIHFWKPGQDRKRRKERASVPMTPELREVLEQVRYYATSKRVCSGVRNVYYWVKKAFAEVGIPEATPHTLRHTAATHMARRGVPLWIIAGVLGNTLAVVEKNYAHHCPDNSRQAVQHIPVPKAKTEEEEVDEWFA